MDDSSQVKIVIDQLLTDEHVDLRNTVMASYLEDTSRGDDLMLSLKLDAKGFEKVPVDRLPVGLNSIGEQVVSEPVDLSQQLGQFTRLGLLLVDRRV